MLSSVLLLTILLVVILISLFFLCSFFLLLLKSKEIGQQSKLKYLSLDLDCYDIWAHLYMPLRRPIKSVKALHLLKNIIKILVKVGIYASTFLSINPRSKSILFFVKLVYPKYSNLMRISIFILKYTINF